MRVRLLINADDLGLTSGVNQGIVDAVVDGVVTSATAMACVGAGEAGVRLGLARFGQRIGVHLQLTGGAPCLPPEQIPTLVGPDGRFRRQPQQLAGLCAEQIALEWQAQIARLAAWGVTPTHLDTHHHVHRRREVLPVFIALARRLGLPTRGGDSATTAQLRRAGVVCPDALIMLSSLPTLSVAAVLGRVRLALRLAGPDSVVELGCHPGHCDAALAEVSTYSARRQHELRLLTSPDLRAALTQQGLHWGGHADLPGPLISSREQP